MLLLCLFLGVADATNYGGSFQTSWLDAPENATVRQKIIADHTYARLNFANPNATNMITPLIWDSHLASVAQTYLNVNGCVPFFQHNPDRLDWYCQTISQGTAPWGEVCGSGNIFVGENWFGGIAADPSTSFYGGAVYAWTSSRCDYVLPENTPCPDDEYHHCSEMDNFYKSTVAELHNTVCGASGSTTGHFTQCMWAKTSHFGCGYTDDCGTLCNYGTAGNLNLPPSPSVDNCATVTGPCWEIAAGGTTTTPTQTAGGTTNTPTQTAGGTTNTPTQTAGGTTQTPTQTATGTTPGGTPTPTTTHVTTPAPTIKPAGYAYFGYVLSPLSLNKITLIVGVQIADITFTLNGDVSYIQQAFTGDPYAYAPGLETTKTLKFPAMTHFDATVDIITSSANILLYAKNWAAGIYVFDQLFTIVSQNDNGHTAAAPGGKKQLIVEDGKFNGILSFRNPDKISWDGPSEIGLINLVAFGVAGSSKYLTPTKIYLGKTPDHLPIVVHATKGHLFSQNFQVLTTACEGCFPFAGKLNVKAPGLALETIPINYNTGVTQWNFNHTFTEVDTLEITVTYNQFNNWKKSTVSFQLIVS